MPDGGGPWRSCRFYKPNARSAGAQEANQSASQKTRCFPFAHGGRDDVKRGKMPPGRRTVVKVEGTATGRGLVAGGPRVPGGPTAVGIVWLAINCGDWWIVDYVDGADASAGRGLCEIDSRGLNFQEPANFAEFGPLRLALPRA